MGKLSDRISRLNDYPGNKSPLAPSKTRRSSEQLGVQDEKSVVADRISSISPEDIIHRMGSGSGEDDIELMLNNMGSVNAPISSSETLLAGSNTAKQVTNLSPLDEVVAGEEISKTLLLSAGIVKTLPDIPGMLDRGISESSGELTFDLGPQTGSEIAVSSETQQGIQDAFSAINSFENLNVHESPTDGPSVEYQNSESLGKMDLFADVASKNEFVGPANAHSQQQQQVSDFFKSSAMKIKDMEDVVSVIKSEDEIVYKIYDNDVMAVEVEVMDITGRISDIIDQYQLATSQVVIPVEMTTIPEPVMPARHGVASIAGGTYFMPHTTDVTKRCETFLAECVDELRNGNTVSREIINIFEYGGKSYSAPSFTMKELSYILSSLRKYGANVHEGQGSLKLVAGEYKS